MDNSVLEEDNVTRDRAYCRGMSLLGLASGPCFEELDFQVNQICYVRILGTPDFFVPATKIRLNSPLSYHGDSFCKPYLKQTDLTFA